MRNLTLAIIGAATGFAMLTSTAVDVSMAKPVAAPIIAKVKLRID